MIKDVVLNEIKRSKDYYSLIPVPNVWEIDQFRQYSYAMSAYDELIRYVQESKLRPIAAVREFADLMERYSCMGGAASYIFAVAYDVADDVYYDLMRKDL